MEFIMINEMEAKKLPFKYPLITGYQGLASLYAILENYPKTLDWIYSNYIQTYGYIRNGNFELTIFPGFEAMKICPWINFSLISRELVKKLNMNIIDFAINNIDANNYLYVMLDQHYLLSSRSGNKNHFAHDTFIYGYDTKKCILNIADFTFNNKYSFEEVSFNEIDNAYNAVDSNMDRPFFTGKGGVALVNYFENGIYEFDVQLIKETLNDYINSTNTTTRYRFMENPNPYAVYGIKIYEKLIEYLMFVGEGKIKCDIKPLHNLYDHKKLMLERIKYMEYKGYIRNANEVITRLSAIENTCLLLSNKTIKYNLSSNNKIIESIITQIQELCKDELDILKKLIIDIKDIPVKVNVSDWFGLNKLN